AETMPKVDDCTEVSEARGHTAEDFFPFLYVIDQGASASPQARLEIRHATARAPAARQFATSRTLSQHLGWPQETRHRVPSCTPATISAPVRHHRATVASTT